VSLSQPKIDLAVLYKLRQQAEAGGGALPPADVTRLFEIEIPLRRVELALEALDAKGDIERDLHEFYPKGAWEISRDGMMIVDRALRVPSSFICRLHQNGDHWLESEEAQKAVLKRLSEPSAANEASIILGNPLSLPRTRQVDWTMWGTLLTGVGIVVAVALWLFS
jgi:hypothetical protein